MGDASSPRSFLTVFTTWTFTSPSYGLAVYLSAGPVQKLNDFKSLTSKSETFHNVIYLHIKRGYFLYKLGDVILKLIIYLIQDNILFKKTHRFYQLKVNTT